MQVWGRGERSAFSKSRVYHDASHDDPVMRLDLKLYSVMGDALAAPQNIRPISIIESAEKPFTPGGNPLTRFEKGYWKDFRIASRLGQSFDRATNSNDTDERWLQFLAMQKVDPVAAVKSHSWGWPQIMGKWHKQCGCETVEAFLDLMSTPEGQCRAFIRFVDESKALRDGIRKGDGDAVGYHYNGPKYARNKYAEKYNNLSQRSLA